MRCFIGVFAIVLIASQGLEPGTAKAWGSYRERLTLELELGAGVLGQNTTGVGAPLLSSGYDRQPGLALDLGWRVLVRDNRYYRHGVMLRGLYQAGPFLGVGGYGFRFGVVELAYSGRVLFPCMSDDRREVSLEAHIGIGGGYADAGLGTG
ncbi:MAG: hypothetical protein OEY14_09955, partial [Myxococcales bacterium]|nr:hypothetical protein [Myxococcales bacterium]